MGMSTSRVNVPLNIDTKKRKKEVSCCGLTVVEEPNLVSVHVSDENDDHAYERPQVECEEEGCFITVNGAKGMQDAQKTKLHESIVSVIKGKKIDGHSKKRFVQAVRDFPPGCGPVASRVQGTTSVKDPVERYAEDEHVEEFENPDCFVRAADINVAVTLSPESSDSE